MQEDIFSRPMTAGLRKQLSTKAVLLERAKFLFNYAVSLTNRKKYAKKPSEKKARDARRLARLHQNLNAETQRFQQALAYANSLT